MFKTSAWFVCVAVVLMGLCGQSVLAKTVVVGPSTCNPGPAHFPTIQQGVNAVAPAGSGTVLVCAGVYPEQVVITTPLTLEGIANGNAGAVVITVPPGGLAPSIVTPTYGLVQAQVLVQNTTFVTLNSITVDGTGATCPTLSGANSLIGIEIYNVGSPAPPAANGSITTNGGNITNVTVRNELACGLGQAIDVENSYITINKNNVHDFDGTGITETGGITLIANNTLLCNTAGAGVTAITLSGTTGSVVSNNAIGHCPGKGVHLMGGSTLVTVSGNDFGPYVGLGIYVDNVSKNSIMGNRASYTDTGIWLAGAGGNSVQGNQFAHLIVQGMLDEFSLGGNSLLNNSVNEAPIGIYQIGTAGDTIAQNDFDNVTALTAP